ncbi:unnamed protein product, partial [Trichobilharzia regenti]
FRLKAYICYRKSLVKQCIISYEPEVLYWYRVPNTMDYDFTDLDKRYEEETSKCSLPSLSKPDQCCDQVNNEAPDNNNNNSSAATDSPPDKKMRHCISADSETVSQSDVDFRVQIG